MESPTRLTESLTTLPVDYWETEGSIRGALVDNVSPDGLILLSIRDIPADSELNVRIFYANGYELDSVKVVANIVSKGLYIAEDWKGHKYGLELVQISQEDRRKLKNLPNSHVELKKISGREDVPLGDPALEKASLPSFPNSGLPAELNANCRFYENGKCLHTRAFCDLCHNQDEINLVQGRSTFPKSKSRSSGRFTSTLSKLADNLRSTFEKRIRYGMRHL